MRRVGIVTALVVGLCVSVWGNPVSAVGSPTPHCSKAAKRAHHGRCPASQATSTTTSSPRLLQWSAPDQIDPNEYGLYSVSCPTASFCVAAGSTGPGGVRGSSRTWNGSAWSAPAPELFAQNTFNHVSCPSASFCVAGAPDGGALAWDGSSWSTTAQIRWPDPNDGITNVSCASPSFCAAGDEDGDIRIWNGTSWSIDHQVVPGSTSGGAHAISCPTATFCMAVNLLGNAIIWDGNAFSAPQPITPNGEQLAAVSCASPTFCMALDGPSKTWLTWNGSSWSTPQPMGAYQPDPNSIFLNGLSCPTATFCVAVGSNGTVSEWHGATWSPAQSIDANLANFRGPAAVTTNEHPNLGLESIACPAANLCVAVGSDGTAIIGRAG